MRTVNLQTNRPLNRPWSVAALGLVVMLAACRPGYMKASELESKEQGPDHCAARCHELGMEMAALVLVADQLPGCVCMPRSEARRAAELGAGASTTAYAVVLAAAAAAQQQRQQQLQQQQAAASHR